MNEKNDDMTYIVNFVIKKYKNKNLYDLFKTEIDLSLDYEEPEHLMMVCKCIFENVIRYDNQNKYWIYYGYNNVLKNTKKNIIFILLIKTFLIKLYNDIAMNFYNDSLNTNQMTAAHNIVMKLQNINFITALIKLIKTY